MGELVDDAELVSKSYVGNDPSLPKAFRGRESVNEIVAAYRAAFPDLKITIMDQVADGNLVATRRRARGRHGGEL